ncbi:hypothetical protein PAMP_005397 [Pampus punctatissimus]
MTDHDVNESYWMLWDIPAADDSDPSLIILHLHLHCINKPVLCVLRLAPTCVSFTPTTCFNHTRNNRGSLEANHDVCRAVQVNAHLDLVHVSDSDGSSSFSGTKPRAATARSPPLTGSAAPNLARLQSLQNTADGRATVRSGPLRPACPTPKHPNPAGSSSHLVPVKGGVKATRARPSLPEPLRAQTTHMVTSCQGFHNKSVGKMFSENKVRLHLNV